MSVTIILPTYNRLNYLKTALSSVLNQSFEKVHVLVGNNASEDGTYEFLNNLDTKKLSIINRSSNIGHVANFSDLLSRVETDFVSFIGDDDWLGPNFIENRIAKFSQHPKCSVVYGGYKKVNQLGEIIAEVSLGENQFDKYSFAKACLNHQVFWQSCLFKTVEVKEIWTTLSKQNIFDYCLMLEISARENLITQTVGNSSDLFVRFHEGSDSNKTMLNTFKITDEYLKFHSNRNLNSEDILLERFHWNLMAARRIRENHLGSCFLYSLEALKIKPLNRSSWSSLAKDFYSWFKK